MKPNHDELIPTRATLIGRLQNWNDDSSWRDFFNIYWKLIYGVARKAGLTDSEAQDVVQETLISVAKHMPTFKYDPSLGSFKAWLLNMARWRIIGQFRKRPPLAEPGHEPGASTSETPAIEAAPDPNSLDLDAVWEAEWEQNLFSAALDHVKHRMDPTKYQIFDFYARKDWPAEKVAATFGVPVELVYQTKHRTTDLIRAEVERLSQEVT